MIIENKGSFNISELIGQKHSIKLLDFKNISEITSINLLKDFKLLSELKLSTCFIENNKLDLSETCIDTLTISNCYFSINDIIMPATLKHLVFKLTTIQDFKIYENLKNLINLEYDLCDFKTSFSIEEINNLHLLDIISITNCNGLSDIDSLLKKDRPLKIIVKNTDLKFSINHINSGVDLELESFKKMKLTGYWLEITAK
jgi:hypothetical protein